LIAATSFQQQLGHLIYLIVIIIIIVTCLKRKFEIVLNSWWAEIFAEDTLTRPLGVIE
jgi:hypothetical protein